MCSGGECKDFSVNSRCGVLGMKGEETNTAQQRTSASHPTLLLENSSLARHAGGRPDVWAQRPQSKHGAGHTTAASSALRSGVLRGEQ